MLNILNLTTGMAMLGDDVKSYREAYYWLEVYRRNYEVVFNSSDDALEVHEFVIVRQCDCCGAYHIIQ